MPLINGIDYQPTVYDIRRAVLDHAGATKVAISQWLGAIDIKVTGGDEVQARAIVKSLTPLGVSAVVHYVDPAAPETHVFLLDRLKRDHGRDYPRAEVPRYQQEQPWRPGGPR